MRQNHETKIRDPIKYGKRRIVPTNLGHNNKQQTTNKQMGFSFLKNLLFTEDGYKSHPEAVIIACYFNPEKSPYRLKTFNIWYDSIKHLNHRIVECIIGEGRAELPNSEFISRVRTDSLLWHKEALLNKLIKDLPRNIQYVFWLDADIIFTNQNWLVGGVEALKVHKIIQPFEYGIHLNRDETKPGFNVDFARKNCDNPALRNPQMWRSFASNDSRGLTGNENYDIHGHVGFAWGAKRSVLEKVPLYDKALIGGADHIIAHAAVGQIPHSCISKAFTENMPDIIDWSERFFITVGGSIGYVKGDVYHLWHGDLEKREYLKRVQDFSPHLNQIKEKDYNGLYKTTDPNATGYMKDYYEKREVPHPAKKITKQLPDRKKRYRYKNIVYRYNDTGSLVNDLGDLIYDIALLNAIIDDGDSYYADPIYDPVTFQPIDQDPPIMDGGDFGGGGASGNWQDNNNNNQSNNDTTYTGSTFS